MGAANPQASVGGLTDEVLIQMHYSPTRDIGNASGPVKVFAINFNTQTLEDTTMAIPKDKGATHVVFRKAMRFTMSSGVLVANPGSETGELLIGYPFSAVSTSQSTEQMTIKLRCYLGAGIYRPENVSLHFGVLCLNVQSNVLTRVLICYTGINSSPYRIRGARRR